MIFKSAIIFAGLLSSTLAAERNLRAEPHVDKDVGEIEHLDLELTLANGDRELFPLLPGTKCPPGHTCRVRTNTNGFSPMSGALKKNIKTPLAMTLNWEEFDTNVKTTVASDNYCTRRNAMARAAGLVAGLSVAAVNNPAYAAETKVVRMGSDAGLLAFVPQKTTICPGDSVTW